MSLSRRSFIASAAATGAYAAVARPNLAQAKAPLAGLQTPGVQRFRVGAVEVTALLDGHLDVGPDLILGYDAETARNLLRGPDAARGTPRIPVNAYLLNFGDRLVLIDSGAASSMGPKLGGLPQALAAVDVAPEQIDAVLITHMHLDHVNGLVDDAGAARFPNARVMIAEADWRFAFDDAAIARASEGLRPVLLSSRPALEAHRDRIEMLPENGDVLPGVTAIPLPGHTPGQTGFAVSSEGETLMVLGDILHVAAFQFAHPEWTLAFDLDPDQAIATRKRVLDMLAADGLLFTGMHIPFPGLGYVERSGEAYRRVAADWQYEI